MPYLLQHTPRHIFLIETDERFLERERVAHYDFQTLDRLTADNPACFSFSTEMTPARNQGVLGTCASFGITACLEFFHKRDLSEACITDETERIYGDCTGSPTMGQLMNLARQRGVVEEQYWPYDGAQICYNPPPNIGGYPRFTFRDFFLFFKRPQALVIDGMRESLSGHPGKPSGDPGQLISRIKTFLANSRSPLCIDVPVFWRDKDKMDAGWEFGPDIKMPTPVNLMVWLEYHEASFEARASGGGEGWHTIVLCGYDDTTHRFEFKNSWGWWWGNSGFGTIPYEYIQNYSREAYVGVI